MKQTTLTARYVILHKFISDSILRVEIRDSKTSEIRIYDLPLTDVKEVEIASSKVNASAGVDVDASFKGEFIDSAEAKEEIQVKEEESEND